MNEATGPQGPAGPLTPAAAVANLDPNADVAVIVTAINNLLSNLRNAGMMES